LQSSTDLHPRSPVAVPQAWPHTTNPRALTAAIFRQREILSVSSRAIRLPIRFRGGDYPDGGEPNVAPSNSNLQGQHAGVANNRVKREQTEESPRWVSTSTQRKRKQAPLHSDPLTSDYSERNAHMPKASA